MTAFYLDVSAVGNEYQAYAATPTWGALSTDVPLPMDGNGKAGPGHAAAVAIAEIQITVQPADTNTLVIAGATLTAKTAVAAKNQFAIGGSIATTVSNLVSLINTYGTGSNQCDAAVNSGSSAALLALPYFVFARVKPGATDTLQIATRFAGADMNQASNSNVAISSAGWATPPTLTQFAGGADGPFSYLVTGSTVFGKTARTYGLLTATKSGTPTDPGAAADCIFVRTRRSSVDLGVTITDSATRYDWVLGPTSTNRQFIFDDGTTWSGDAGEFVLTLNATSGVSSGNNTLQPPAATLSLLSPTATKRFRLYVNVTTGSYAYEFRYTSSSSIVLMEGVTLEESSGNIAGAGLAMNGNDFGPKVTVSNSKWIAKGARTLMKFGANPGAKTQYVNCEFEYFGLTGNVTGIVNGAGVGHDQTFEAVACKFYDRNGVYSITNPVTGVTGNQSAQKIIFDGCSGIDAVASGWTAQISDFNRLLLWENFGPNRDWRLEVGSWLTEWRYGQSHPTLTSTLQNGTPWSAKTIVRNSMIWGVPQRPFKINGYYRDATAAKTITLEFLAAQTFPKSQLGILVAYIDSNDVVRYEHTLETRAKGLAGTGSNCATSAASWTLNGQTGFTAYKCALTTAYSIKTGTEFVVFVLVNGTVASDQTLYFNGEVALT